MRTALTIAIPTYNRPKELARTLMALLPQVEGRSNISLVIIDNASEPESMSCILNMLHTRYGKIKIMITESGSAEKKSKIRNNNFQKEIIDTHFWSVIEYQKKYNTILGYVYWTLMDNYEWEDGYKPKFGLYTMSYKNGDRIYLLKDSGEYYREAIKNAEK